MGLSWFDAGVRSFYTRKRWTAGDLQGMTHPGAGIGHDERDDTDLGAKPVQVVYSQVYAALHNGRDRRRREQLAQLRGHGPLRGSALLFERMSIPVCRRCSWPAGLRWKSWPAGRALPGASSAAAPGRAPMWSAASGPSGRPGRRRYAGMGRGSDRPCPRPRKQIPGGGRSRCMSGLPSRRSSSGKYRKRDPPSAKSQKLSQRELFAAGYMRLCTVLNKRQELGHVVQKKFSHSFEKQDIF